MKSRNTEQRAFLTPLAPNQLRVESLTITILLHFDRKPAL